MAYLSPILQMRLLVGFLGERAQYGWWPTAFYEASSHQFLEPVFSKTTRLAQYHAVVEAARRLHDEHLSVGSFHLFRLPEEIEQNLHALVQSGAGGEPTGRVSLGKDAALESLKRLAPRSIKASEGPTNMGSIRDIESLDVLSAIAGAYVSAFSQNGKTYPYLVR
jgi:hypothetical protein